MAYGLGLHSTPTRVHTSSMVAKEEVNGFAIRPRNETEGIEVATNGSTVMGKGTDTEPLWLDDEGGHEAAWLCCNFIMRLLESIGQPWEAAGTSWRPWEAARTRLGATGTSWQPWEAVGTCWGAIGTH
ncbi:unnamed protein product [Prunus armeniaca]|uniref:Uncharacterized protein n=1 Tax=Prunus armeniaca TaxID=36596 RepID=A0A6J5XRI7_PRUAR|nr:unnamed protein product [Prunus armeniaca]